MRIFNKRDRGLIVHFVKTVPESTAIVTIKKIVRKHEDVETDNMYEVNVIDWLADGLSKIQEALDCFKSAINCKEQHFTGEEGEEGVNIIKKLLDVTDALVLEELKHTTGKELSDMITDTLAKRGHQ